MWIKSSFGIPRTVNVETGAHYTVDTDGITHHVRYYKPAAESISAAIILFKGSEREAHSFKDELDSVLAVLEIHTGD